jgi:hypothetical protein
VFAASAELAASFDVVPASLRGELASAVGAGGVALSVIVPLSVVVSSCGEPVVSPEHAGRAKVVARARQRAKRSE